MLSSNELLSLLSPQDVQQQLAAAFKHARLELKGWKRATLAERSGVPSATIKRFENTGEISLRQLLMLAHALGQLEAFDQLFHHDLEGMSMDEYIYQHEHKARKRGVQ